MMQQSVIAMVGVLQKYGLSIELLQVMVEHCEQKRTGGVSLYTSQGQIVKYELRSCGTVVACDEMPLTRLA